jgi:hypothetical protein
MGDEHLLSPQEGSERREERTRDPHLNPYRVLLESALRLHQLLDPGRFPRQAIETLHSVLGAPEGVLVLHVAGGAERHAFGRQGPMTRDRPDAMAKATESGSPVIDGVGSDRALVVPMTTGLSVHGVLVVGVSALEERFGPSYVDLVALLARHLGLAFENGRRLADLGGDAGTEVDLPPEGVSFRDAKAAFERRLIRTRFLEAGGNIASAARSLGMDRGQLSRLLKRFGFGRDMTRGSEE